MNRNEITDYLNSAFGNIFVKPKSNSKIIFSHSNFRIIIIRNTPLVERKTFKIFSINGVNMTLAYCDVVGCRGEYMISEEELFQQSLMHNIPFSHEQLLSLRNLYKKLGNVRIGVSFSLRETND